MGAARVLRALAATECPLEDTALSERTFLLALLTAWTFGIFLGPTIDWSTGGTYEIRLPTMGIKFRSAANTPHISAPVTICSGSSTFRMPK